MASQDAVLSDDCENDNWLICTACGTQFPTADGESVTRCFICDDPRQYTRPTGQAFTTLATLRTTHTNSFTEYPGDGHGSGRPGFSSIETQPKFAIGQRAILVRTAAGRNVLWDCVSLLDAATHAELARRGGLDAIVISHPHYYTTHLAWAAAFGCPVYLAAEDAGAWAAQRHGGRQVLLTDAETVIADGVRAVKLGGHFPGSLVLLVRDRLLIADTLLMTPAGLGNWTTDALGRPRTGGRPRGMNSFAFMWSIPNAIPLSADAMASMWGVLKRYEFRSAHGAFVGQDIEDDEVKGRVLESMQIQARYMGWERHALMQE